MIFPAVSSVLISKVPIVFGFPTKVIWFVLEFLRDLIPIDWFTRFVLWVFSSGFWFSTDFGHFPQSTHRFSAAFSRFIGILSWFRFEVSSLFARVSHFPSEKPPYLLFICLEVLLFSLALNLSYALAFLGIPCIRAMLLSFVSFRYANLLPITRFLSSGPWFGLLKPSSSLLIGGKVRIHCWLIIN